MALLRESIIHGEGIDRHLRTKFFRILGHPRYESVKHVEEGLYFHSLTHSFNNCVPTQCVPGPLLGPRDGGLNKTDEVNVPRSLLTF